MTWILLAWLCAANGECRPAPDLVYQTRSECLRVERDLHRNPLEPAILAAEPGETAAAVHCRHRKAEAGS